MILSISTAPAAVHQPELNAWHKRDDNCRQDIEAGRSEEYDIQDRGKHDRDASLREDS
jgi:hypothetical protein